VIEHLKGSKITAITARPPKARAHTRRVVIATDEDAHGQAQPGYEQDHDCPYPHAGTSQEAHAHGMRH
jgi:hypothetical protein